MFDILSTVPKMLDIEELVTDPLTGVGNISVTHEPIVVSDLGVNIGPGSRPPRKSSGKLKKNKGELNYDVGSKASTSRQVPIADMFSPNTFMTESENILQIVAFSPPPRPSNSTPLEFGTEINASQPFMAGDDKFSKNVESNLQDRADPFVMSAHRNEDEFCTEILYFDTEDSPPLQDLSLDDHTLKIKSGAETEEGVTTGLIDYSKFLGDLASDDDSKSSSTCGDFAAHASPPHRLTKFQAHRYNTQNKNKKAGKSNRNRSS